MSDELEEKVKDYGHIMELCFVEAGRIMSSNAWRDLDGPELCRQITHDLFVAVTGESRKQAELDVIAKLKEAADSFRKPDDDEISLQALMMTPTGPVIIGGLSGHSEHSENGEDPVLPEPPKRKDGG